MKRFVLLGTLAAAALTFGMSRPASAHEDYDHYGYHQGAAYNHAMQHDALEGQHYGWHDQQAYDHARFHESGAAWGPMHFLYHAGSAIEHAGEHLREGGDHAEMHYQNGADHDAYHGYYGGGYAPQGGGYGYGGYGRY